MNVCISHMVDLGQLTTYLLCPSNEAHGKMGSVRFRRAEILLYVHR